MILSRREVICGLAVSALGFARPAFAAQQAIGGYAFGSTWRLVTDGAVGSPLIRSVVQTVIDRVDMEMSPYNAASDLTRFNTNQSTAQQPMPSSICEVAEKALAVAEQTNGAFDPTVGPIVGRHGFGPIVGTPGQYEDISVGANAISKADARLTLDLCGLAKGYALDQIIAALSAIGVTHALVEIGGEVRALGHHTEGRPWRVAIADPLARDFKAHRIITPKHRALATSGNAANGVSGPMSTGHIIDPRQGRPVTTALASVSVLADSAIEADALATALYAAGVEEGITLARQLEIAALFVSSGPAFPAEVMTGAFADYVVL